MNPDIVEPSEADVHEALKFVDQHWDGHKPDDKGTIDVATNRHFCHMCGTTLAAIPADFWSTVQRQSNGES